MGIELLTGEPLPGDREEQTLTELWRLRRTIEQLRRILFFLTKWPKGLPFSWKDYHKANAWRERCLLAEVKCEEYRLRLIQLDEELMELKHGAR